MIDRIPIALRSRRQWVLWATAHKIPYQITGDTASVSDPATWNTFDAVQARLARGGYLGIGYVFAAGDPFCGIDLDSCRDPVTGSVADWARQIILACNTYAEISPSRTGVKLFAIGKSPFDTGKKIKIADAPARQKAPGIEIYDHGRYFAVTGLKLAGMPSEPVECQAAIDAMCSRYFPAPVIRPTGSSTSTGAAGPDTVERARRYVAKMPPAISGSGGHDAAYRTACVLVLGFALSIDEAYPLFVEYNERCEPPWNEREIWHKLNDADKLTDARGYLLANRSQHDEPDSDPLPIAPPRWCYGHRAHAAALAHRSGVRS